MGNPQKSHKDLLKNLWGQFLRSHFQNVQHVAVFFGVREQTAQYWWDEMHAPAGWVINLAWCEMPAQAAAHLRLVADNPAPVAPAPVGREKSARVA